MSSAMATSSMPGRRPSRSAAVNTLKHVPGGISHVHHQNRGMPRVNGKEALMSAALEQTGGDQLADNAEAELTDGFHLVIDALKLNGVKTIYNVTGIQYTVS